MGWYCLFFFQAEDGIRDYKVTGVQTCALPISRRLIGAQEIFLLAHHSHAAPTAARGSLQNQWVAYALRFFRELLFSFHNSVASRNRGQPRGLHFAARAVFLSH